MGGLFCLPCKPIARRFGFKPLIYLTSRGLESAGKSQSKVGHLDSSSPVLLLWGCVHTACGPSCLSISFLALPWTPKGCVPVSLIFHLGASLWLTPSLTPHQASLGQNLTARLGVELTANPASWEGVKPQMLKPLAWGWGIAGSLRGPGERPESPRPRSSAAYLHPCHIPRLPCVLA